MNFTEFKEKLGFLDVMLTKANITNTNYRNIGNNQYILEFSRVVDGKEVTYQLSNDGDIFYLYTNEVKALYGVTFKNIQEIEDYFYKIFNKDEIFVQKINYYFKDLATNIVCNESQSELVICGLIYGISNQFDKWVLSYNSLNLPFNEYESLGGLFNENFTKDKLKEWDNIQKAKYLPLYEIERVEIPVNEVVNIVKNIVKNKDEIFVQKINYYFKDLATNIDCHDSQSELIINGLIYGISNRSKKWVLTYNRSDSPFDQYNSLEELFNENFNKDKKKCS